MSDRSELPIFGYWNSRGRGEPIRYLLSYTGTKYVDKRYSFSSSDEWFKRDKFNLGLDFPNLPYYIDGDVKLTQSLAILQYLGRQHDLVGQTEKEQVVIDLIQEQITDTRTTLRTLCASNNFEEDKKAYLEALPTQLAPLEKFFAVNGREFVAGKRITYVDFYAYEVLDLVREFASDIFANYPSLVAYLNRFESLPAIQKHQNNKSFTKHIRFAPYLKWGYPKED